MTPKVYLISRNLTDEQLQRVQEALSITPLDAVVCPDIRDMQTAQQFAQCSAQLARPIAIFADFDVPLTAVQEDGSLCPLL